MSKKYTLVVDCGIPYEETVSEKKLMNELRNGELKINEHVK